MRPLITLSAATVAGLLAAGSPAIAESKTFFVPDTGNTNRWLEHPAKFQWSATALGMFGFAKQVHWARWGTAKAAGNGRTSLAFMASPQGKHDMAFSITAGQRRSFGEGHSSYVYCRVTLRGKFSLNEPKRTVTVTLPPPENAACN